MHEGRRVLSSFGQLPSRKCLKRNKRGSEHLHRLRGVAIRVLGVWGDEQLSKTLKGSQYNVNQAGVLWSQVSTTFDS